MAADSDGCRDLTTVVTCEGNLSDPDFEDRFGAVVDKLNSILGEEVKVHKLEPWNSVRVTLSIPREAALRLRKLASEGSAQLRALGILSVQVEGDQVISLRIASSLNAEPQEILLQTTQDGSSSSRSESEGALSRILAGPSTSTPTNDPAEKIHFKSPNVVCPSDSVVPKVPPSPVIPVATATNSTTPPSTSKSFGGPFPFASMNQAIHTTSREATPQVPPPPYPGTKHPATQTVTMSSPLLVNLLQNDGSSSQKKSDIIANSVKVSAPVVVNNRTMIANNQTVFNNNRSAIKGPDMDGSSLAALINTNNNNKTVNLQLPLLANKQVQPVSGSSSQASTSSPSALNNTSISRQNNNNTNHKLTSTMFAPAVAPSTSSLVAPPPPPLPPSPRNLPPPPPYSVAINNRHWDSVVQTTALMDLTPSLTDLKSDDLDDLIPCLERDLARSPPEIPEELTRSNERNFLINPLTGELEPQSSGESETEELGDVFTGLPSPAHISDDDTNSTTRPDTMTDHSDSETRSSHSDSGKHSRIKSKVRDRGRDSPNLKPATEKIKLRLKLEKSEPVNSAYKVDVSFIQQPKKAASMSPGSEELRVPPLHISLRGRHHFITNKKKAKLHSDKPKMRKELANKTKKNFDDSAITNETDSSNLSGGESDPAKKVKKLKLNHENGTNELMAESDLLSKLVMSNSTHYKEKHKERRGSDSELSRNNMKFIDSNGLVSLEKKRRLSQTETIEAPAILGSTNVGTIAGLPQKIRKEKSKLKEAFIKNKELARNNKNFNKTIGENYIKQVTLPTGEIDMEAKFKQRLLEGSERGISRPPHRTDEVIDRPLDRAIIGENSLQIDETTDKITSKPDPEPEPDPISSSSSAQEKSPEPDKCNTPDRKQNDLGDKQPNRSPNSGAQGEDSGIESMDALSEKSPNQASQSPHADIIPEQPPVKTSKLQVPDMLDIEAQLAKMEGLNGVEDVNENNQHGGTQAKMGGQCCELTSALQDSLKHGTVTLASVNTTAGGGQGKEQIPNPDVILVPIKSKPGEENLDPMPVRVTPPLYTYSNPEKSRGSESPTLSEEEFPSMDNQPQQQQQQQQPKSKSLLEQLLIDIPDSQSPSSPSPATRSSVRTRALSKLNSPELNSPVLVKHPSRNTNANVAAPTKRRRNESDSSAEDGRNKKTRKSSENASEMMKVCMGVEAKVNNVKKGQKLQDESSDSDEPLIEKVRKTAAHTNNVTGKTKVKTATSGGNKSVGTRRSIRAVAPNTRSKGEKLSPDVEAIRRKTRSADGESKRKKEIK